MTSIRLGQGQAATPPAPVPGEILAVPVSAHPVARLLHSAIHYRDFRVLWFGLLGASTAFNLQMVATGYVAFELTRSTTAIGVMWLIWGGSQLVLSPIGGAIADRWPKRDLLRVTQTALGLSSLAIAILISLGQIEFWHLIAFGLVQGVVFSFNGPARMGFIPMVVPRERVANAVALQNGAQNLTTTTAPAISGLLIAMPGLGPAAVFYAMAVLYLVVQASLLLVHNRGISATAGARPSILAEARDGLRFAAASAPIRKLMLLALAPILIGSAPGMMLAPYTAIHLHADGSVLGLLYSAIGIGAILGSATMAYFASIRRRGLLQLLLGIGLGVGLAVAGATTAVPVALLGFVIAGAFQNAYLSSNSALLIMHAPREMYGRVMGLQMLLFSLTGFAAVPFGMVVDLIGPGTTFFLFGVVLVTVMLFALVALRDLRALGAPASADTA